VIYVDCTSSSPSSLQRLVFSANIHSSPSTTPATPQQAYSPSKSVFFQLYPAESVYQIEWQGSGSEGVIDPDRGQCVCAVLTSRRIVFLSATTLTPICSIVPDVSAPHPPFISCLWAGPTLLYTTRSHVMAASLDGSSNAVCTTPSHDNVLAGCTIDRLVLLSGRQQTKAQVLLRPVHLSQSLILGIPAWLSFLKTAQPHSLGHSLIERLLAWYGTGHFTKEGIERLIDPHLAISVALAQKPLPTRHLTPLLTVLKLCARLLRSCPPPDLSHRTSELIRVLGLPSTAAQLVLAALEEGDPNAARLSTMAKDLDVDLGVIVDAVSELKKEASASPSSSSTSWTNRIPLTYDPSPTSKVLVVQSSSSTAAGDQTSPTAVPLPSLHTTTAADKKLGAILCPSPEHTPSDATPLASQAMASVVSGGREPPASIRVDFVATDTANTMDTHRRTSLGKALDDQSHPPMRRDSVVSNKAKEHVKEEEEDSTIQKDKRSTENVVEEKTTYKPSAKLYSTAEKTHTDNAHNDKSSPHVPLSDANTPQSVNSSSSGFSPTLSPATRSRGAGAAKREPMVDEDGFIVRDEISKDVTAGLSPQSDFDSSDEEVQMPKRAQSIRVVIKEKTEASSSGPAAPIPIPALSMAPIPPTSSRGRRSFLPPPPSS